MRRAMEGSATSRPATTTTRAATLMSPIRARRPMHCRVSRVVRPTQSCSLRTRWSAWEGRPRRGIDRRIMTPIQWAAWVSALGALALTVSIGQGRAQPTAASGPGDAAQQKFARDYMAAVIARDVSALKRVIHPASLACIDDTTRDFFDFVLGRELRERPISTYRVTRIGPLEKFPLLPGSPEQFRFPVPPTHEVQIDFDRGPGRSTTLIRAIAFADGAWFEVLVCPTAEGMRTFRRRQQAAAEQRARATQLASTIQEPLLS